MPRPRSRDSPSESAPGAVVDGPHDWRTVQFGSRSSFRIGGAYLPGLDRRLPLLVRTRVIPDVGQTVVQVESANNDGPDYLVRIPALVTIYEQTFDRMLGQLTASLPPAAR